MLLSTKRLPAKASYSVSKLADACQAESQTFDKARQKLFSDAGCTIKVTKISVVDEDGKPKEIERSEWVHDDPAAFDAVKEQAMQLETMEVEINALLLDIDQFGSAELPGNAFTGLDWAVKKE